MDNVSEKIKNVSDELEKLIKIQRDTQEAKRFDTLVKLFDIFIEMEEYKDIKESVYLNKELLAVTIKSYFDDIYRYKLYAHSEFADKDKKSGYLIKWLAKIKPIQILKDAIFSEKLAGVNSFFAVFVGLVFLEIKPDSNYMKKIIESELYDELLYTASFRDICPKQLSSFMKNLLYAAEGKLSD